MQKREIISVAPHDGCEIITVTNDIKTGVKSHPTMSAWIEIFQSMIQKSLTPSHPTMGAWIEITIAPTAFAEHEESHPTMGAKLSQ